MTILSATYHPETGSVVNTDEEFFLAVKLHNPFPTSGPLSHLSFENCKMRVMSASHSEIYPKTNDSLPKTVLANKSVEATAGGDWEQEFTLKADHSVGNAVIEYEAEVDIYFNGNPTGITGVTLPADAGPETIPVSQG